MLEAGLRGSRREHNPCGWRVDAAHLAGKARDKGQLREGVQSEMSNGASRSRVRYGIEYALLGGGD